MSYSSTQISLWPRRELQFPQIEDSVLQVKNSLISLSQSTSGAYNKDQIFTSASDHHPIDWRVQDPFLELQTPVTSLDFCLYFWQTYYQSFICPYSQVQWIILVDHRTQRTDLFNRLSFFVIEQNTEIARYFVEGQAWGDHKISSGSWWDCPILDSCLILPQYPVPRWSHMNILFLPSWSEILLFPVGRERNKQLNLDTRFLEKEFKNKTEQM